METKTQSILHRCPRCNRFIDIAIKHGEDDSCGDSVILTVICRRCNKAASVDLIKGCEVADLVDTLYQEGNR